MHTIRTAFIGIALLATAAAAAAAAPLPVSAQSTDSTVQAELALAHGFLDAQLEEGLRSQLGSIQTVLQGYEGFTPAEMTALERAYAQQLEITIVEAQDMLAKAASNAFTEAELRAPTMISDARWQAVIAPMQDSLILLGATLGAKAVVIGCGSISQPSQSCVAFLEVSRDFLSGEISVEEIRDSANH